MSELAIKDDHAVARAGDEQLVTMKVDDQLFGLPILSAQDIVETHRITQVPMAPSAVAGVMNLRGRIVTVINLRRILGQEENVASRMGVTVEHDGDLYTILVDQIGEVMAVASEDLEPVPTTLNSGLKSLCSGIYRMENGLLALLDIDQILDAETILQTPQIDFAARKRLLRKLKEETANSTGQTGNGDAIREAEPAAEMSIAEEESSGAKRMERRDAAGDAGTGSAAPLSRSEQPREQPMYHRIGGAPAIEAAVGLFYEKVIADDSLANFFEGVDMQRQRKMLKDFVSMAFGGPGQYRGKALRAAHARLVNEKGLGHKHFDAVAGYFEATLKELSVPDDVIREALAIVRSTRGDVLAG